MNNHLYGVYGASGFGREIMPLVRAQLMAIGVSSESIVFIDDAAVSNTINGHAVITFDEFVATEAVEKYVSLAIANSAIREKLMLRCKSSEIRLFNVTAKNALQMDDVVVGSGSIIAPFVTITSNVRIGICFHANLYSYIAHDCVIGDYVTFAPSVHCNGNVLIEDHAYIGTGAIIKQGLPEKPLVIGRGAVVGMGAVVTKDVAAGVTVVGNPARPLLRGT